MTTITPTLAAASQDSQDKGCVSSSSVSISSPQNTATAAATTTTEVQITSPPSAEPAPLTSLSSLQPHSYYTTVDLSNFLTPTQITDMVTNGTLCTKTILYRGNSATVYCLPRVGHATTTTSTTNNSTSASAESPVAVAKKAKVTVEEQEERQRIKQLLAQRHTLTTKRDKLQLVKTYRTSNDVAKLDDLIEKWRLTAIEVLEVLVASYPEATLAKLMDHYNIPDGMLKFNRELNSFE